MKKKHKRGRGWLVVLIALVALAVAFEGAMLFLVVRAEKQPRPLAKADAIIVLGARVQPDGALSTQLEYRVLKALELYQAGLSDYIITTGARGADEPAAEASAMANYLIGRGVPEDRILIEDRSYSTIESLKNAQALLAGRGLATAIVVTSDYHVQRALWYARDIGLSAQGAGTQASNYPALLWQSRLRETLAWMKYFTVDKIPL